MLEWSYLRNVRYNKFIAQAEAWTLDTVFQMETISKCCFKKTANNNSPNNFQFLPQFNPNVKNFGDFLCWIYFRKSVTRMVDATFLGRRKICFEVEDFRGFSFFLVIFGLFNWKNYYLEHQFDILTEKIEISNQNFI